ncbi:hypothetical protein, partial [Cupriavidus consociatus]|uniref:hypothetical protein n=1 Tax=Cupriavidus consociatus TaxID=2821357 RepID=UPI001AE76A9C
CWYFVLVIHHTLPDGKVLHFRFEGALQNKYNDLFDGPVFKEIEGRMRGMDGFLLCRVCEFAEPTPSVE